jgi:hypothetical protein
MPRQPSNLKRKPARKARPVLEGLEDRQLLSSGSSGTATPAALSSGVFSHHHRQFKYAPLPGEIAVIVIQGHGSLAGTYVGSTGLNIEYDNTNTFSKIIGQVYGGNERAPLASILNSNLVASGAQNSLSGVGGNPLQAVILNDWDLVAGGNINLTSGVNSLVLNSIGPDTQVHLRDIPAELLPTALVANAQAVAESSSSSSSSSSFSGSSSSSSRSGSSSSSSSSSTVSPTLAVGAPTEVTNSNGTTWTYVLGTRQHLTLTAVSGSFSAGANVVEPLPAGQPPQTQPPAPPGIILRVNAIYGNPTAPINLLTDPVIWGYDANIGKLVQFSLNLATNTGTPDGVTIPVTGAPSTVGLNLGWNGSQLDVLVGYGTEVYAYNAATGVKDTTNGSTGSFSTAALLGPAPIISIGSTDTVTVLGNNNSLQMINLVTSLQTGMAQLAPGAPTAYSPPPQFTFLGGLTSVPGSTTIYGTVAAHFDTFQPDKYQLGIQPANTVKVNTFLPMAPALTYTFTAGTASAVTVPPTSSYIDVSNDPLDTAQPGPALGSVDSNLALGSPINLVTGTPSPPGTDLIYLLNPSTGSPLFAGRQPLAITLTYPDPIVALSGTFRPDLNGSAAGGSGIGPALIDIQGDVQSIRGRKATGMVLNDSGNLNLVKFATITNSTIVGQPLSHVEVTAHLVNVTMLTPSRTVSTRGGVQVVKNFRQIGPLSFTGD